MTGLATGGLGGAAGAALGKAVAVGAAKGAVAGTIQAGVKQVWQTEHFQQEFTIDEFQHKWIDSGIYPVKISLEQNNELINRYLANRTLKKSGEGNEYFNIATFGNYLTQEGFNKFHFLSLNMSGNYQEWFKEKLQEGVFIPTDPDLVLDVDPTPDIDPNKDFDTPPDTGDTDPGDDDGEKPEDFD